MRTGLMLPFLFALLISAFSESRSQSVKYWIYFKDKGNGISRSGYPVTGGAEADPLSDYVTERALARRAKVLGKDRLIDHADLPVYDPYLRSITDLGGVLVQKSRWLNAASFILSPDLLKTVDALPFVEKTEPVKIFRGRQEYAAAEEPAVTLRKGAAFDYGISYNQLNMPNIIPLHNAGITGKRVLIGLLDSGYRWKLHEALQDRRVLAEYDFIFKDENTANEQNDPEIEDSHGTETFSVIGGFQPGKLIGAAFDAEFLLAKTEYDWTEFQTEEDYWAAGIEWLEGMGADIVSSSLGYDLFDDGTGYFWESGDFDGRTSITARAAARAAQLGVVVCTSMGNEYNGDGVTGTMTTPADADSVISVGAVQFNGRLAIFSSTGPTNDGRIKPDLVAPGVNIYHARVPGPATYGYSQGTSFSTPLTAGSAALLLSVRPEITPIEVREALRSTAVPIDTGAHRPVPNNFTGWGLVDAFSAAASLGPVFSNDPAVDISLGHVKISTYVFSRAGIRPEITLLEFTSGADQAWIPIQMTLDSAVQFPTSGRYIAVLPPMETGTPVRFRIQAADSAGKSYRSPSPAHMPYWVYYFGDSAVREPEFQPPGYALEQNFPNPFNSGTWIEYSLTGNRGQSVSLKVYNTLGQLVSVILDDAWKAGGIPELVYFDASNLPSGVYFYRLTTPYFSSTKKMILVR